MIDSIFLQDISSGIDDFVGIKWWMFLCLICSWLIVYFIVMKGIQVRLIRMGTVVQYSLVNLTTKVLLQENLLDNFHLKIRMPNECCLVTLVKKYVDNRVVHFSPNMIFCSLVWDESSASVNQTMLFLFAVNNAHKLSHIFVSISLAHGRDCFPTFWHIPLLLVLLKKLR